MRLFAVLKFIVNLFEGLEIYFLFGIAILTLINIETPCN